MEQKKTLYLECRSGISGDMTVAALLDLGATEENLRKTLAKLPLEGYEIRISRVRKSGLDACDFDVILEEDSHAEDMRNHSHMHEHGHMHGFDEEHKHSHEVSLHHDHGAHVHTHEHRTWRDIEHMLDGAGLKPRVLELSKQMFRIVADAEGKVHGRPADEVHFHEVGAVDSIVDIVSAAACMEELGIGKIVVSDVWEGQGHAHCQHGILPVPVPAVLQIAAEHGLTLKQTEQQGEMVTPTGAAIAALSEGKKPEKFIIKKIGLGAGKREFPRANVLRAMLIEEAKKQEERLWMLECNIDDCSGEALGYAMECLLEAGARDVFFTPIYMKKNRPAYQVSVLCEEKQIRDMTIILFRETTTIGVRRYPIEREALERRVEEVLTPYGPVKVKVCSFENEETGYPEYESVKKLAKEQGIAYKEMYRRVAEQVNKERITNQK
ncbi:nickel pincer cofactor biosynthesis protein LarC [bacterium 1XD21-13]|nr:nickel pincer cofactor biosynthesis protein LarC [bacterium 1XD21-13]